MRSIPFLPLIAALAAAAPSASAQSSYGPEISAEDFRQHLRALSADTPADDALLALRAAHVERQFARLGLQAPEAGCGPDPAARRAMLPGTGAEAPTVVYLAHWRDASEIAGVLEIAERFTTQRPRPTHGVAFLFRGEDRGAADVCMPVPAMTVIEPRDLLGLDASSLVRELNLLQRQGR